MNITELHDEENLLVQLQDRWENYGSLDAIVDTHDPFTLEGAPRFELSEKFDRRSAWAVSNAPLRVLPNRWGPLRKPFRRNSSRSSRNYGITTIPFSSGNI